MTTDPTRIAAQLNARRARIERDRRWAAVLHQRGCRFNRESIAAHLAGDYRSGERLDAARRQAHGTANGFAQRMLILEGQVERIEDAHRDVLHAANAPSDRRHPRTQRK